LEISQFNLLCGLQGDSRSSHPHRAAQVNRFNTEPISAHLWGFGIWFGWSSARVHLQDHPS
jgi:hypothetical protein